MNEKDGDEAEESVSPAECKEDEKKRQKKQQNMLHLLWAGILAGRAFAAKATQDERGCSRFISKTCTLVAALRPILCCCRVLLKVKANEVEHDFSDKRRESWTTGAVGSTKNERRRWRIRLLVPKKGRSTAYSLSSSGATHSFLLHLLFYILFFEASRLFLRNKKKKVVRRWIRRLNEEGKSSRNFGTSGLSSSCDLEPGGPCTVYNVQYISMC